jgi:type VI secretion system VasD/TssJ family lipoprotein
MASKRLSTTTWAALTTALIFGPLAAGVLASCKKPPPTCNPDDEKFESIRVVVGPMDQINLDMEGKPRATVLKVYQLTDDRILDTVTFEDVWKDAAAAFGDIMLDEQEFVVYPNQPEVHEIKPNPDAKFVVAAAIFREPVGNTWYTTWDAPQFHGHSVCAAKRKKQELGDPCFYVGMELNELDGGHVPPNVFNAEGLDLEKACPGEPLLVEPPPLETAKEKRKRKRKEKRKKRRAKMKKGAKGTQEKAEKGAETNDKANTGADKATTKPEGPSVPGKD